MVVAPVLAGVCIAFLTIDLPDRLIDETRKPASRTGSGSDYRKSLGDFKGFGLSYLAAGLREFCDLMEEMPVKGNVVSGFMA